MDSERFDGLVRSFGQARPRRQVSGRLRTPGTGTSRRQVVPWLAGLGLAGASAIGFTAATGAAPTNGPACCAQEQRGYKAICRQQNKKFNKAAFTCNPDTCGRVAVVCLGFCSEK